MSRKNILTNPYQPGDENHLYFNDEKILKTFASSLEFVDKYFRYSVVGQNHIPKKGPALLICNHGFMPFDLVLLVRQVYAQTGRRIRVLAHTRSWKIPVLREVALNIGVVNAKPENAVRLLKRGELVAVFPGGEREGLKTSSQKYNLFWDERIGFARSAVAAKAPVIPCMGIGIDDIFYVRFPFFMGLGIFPFPRKLTHYIGKPITFHQKISPKTRKGALVKKLHEKAWKESEKLLQQGLKQRKWWE